MTALDEYEPPRSNRLPRVGDKVVAAPKAPDCVSGSVDGFIFAGRRLSVITKSHGRITLPFSRFTWSAKRRAWVCWPLDVLKTIRHMDETENMTTMRRMRAHADVGDYILIDDGEKTQGGWITKLLGRPTTMANEMSINSLDAYLVGTRSGELEIPYTRLRFDRGLLQWVARPPEPA